MTKNFTYNLVSYMYIIYILFTHLYYKSFLFLLHDNTIFFQVSCIQKKCHRCRTSRTTWRIDCRVLKKDCERSKNLVRDSIRFMCATYIYILAVWQISLKEEDWEVCVEGPCKCIPEVKLLSCWKYDLLDLPVTQRIPVDVLKL